MGRAFSRASLVLIRGAGHALVGEKPAEVAALLASWAEGGVVATEQTFD
jgi:pimeloyl-ACP methyl ester carboxylesterase